MRYGISILFFLWRNLYGSKSESVYDKDHVHQCENLSISQNFITFFFFIICIFCLKTCTELNYRSVWGWSTIVRVYLGVLMDIRGLLWLQACIIRADKLVYYKYYERVYFSLFNFIGPGIIEVMNLKCFYIVILYTIFILKILCVLDILLYGNVSQILYLGPSCHFMS